MSQFSSFLLYERAQVRNTISLSHTRSDSDVRTGLGPNSAPTHSINASDRHKALGPIGVPTNNRNCHIKTQD
jgi:hypothetical protein